MRYTIILILGMAFCARIWAADEFDGIKCGTDIRKAMLGKHSLNEPVVATEARHSNLDLKDVGAMEISHRLFLISWRICGNEYAVLLNTDKDLVRDVLPVPAHSLRSPESFVAPCRVAGKEVPDAIVAILDNNQERKPKEYFDVIALPVKVAWRIDENQERFVPMPTEQLTCEVDGEISDFKH